MQHEERDDYVLLRELRDYLQLLASPGSEATLTMETWCHCIGGYAARHPAFNRLGLHFDRGFIAFGPRYGFEALQDFFGLDERQADYLFADHPERTGFERIASFPEAMYRIDEIIRGDI